MTGETKDFIKLIVKAGLVGTALGVPVALALRELIPDDFEVAGHAAKNTAIALGLTALGIAVKEHYLEEAEQA